ncbi:MAG: L-threonylcarbamoyladenylate synthase [Candidatus Saganbacteria bacterium]|nr:L-threonylcarbamoyladenylate synthase [Candidatus Saganbacteria bacterium]
MPKKLVFQEKSIETAKKALSQGSIIAFPTETVYGIGIDFKNAEAIKKIYQLKGREFNKPLQILIADFEQLKNLIEPQKCELIKYWPGPLTLIFYKKDGTGKVGIRMPNYPLLQKLLKETGPIAATSANLSGQPDALTADEVARIFPDIDLILDGGKATIGIASTVVDVTEEPYKILRQGSLVI